MDRLGELAVDADHPSLPGHFPGRPIVPGVVLLDEALAVVAANYGVTAPLRLLRVKFVTPVLPGDRVAVLGDPPVAGAVRFTCICDARPILSAAVQFDRPAPKP
jgi:3-hydroxymyristoyl/3-hydroxydecanoyl-(acyl carrier protein) dehydratase